MIYIDLPTIGQGTSEQQLAEIRSYIYKSNEQMNATLANLTVDKIWEQTASALSASSNNSNETDELMSQYQKVRDLIIKTADIVIQTDEQMKMAMNGSYLAKNQFGEYLLNTSVEIDGKSTGFTQLYTYSSELGSDYGNYKTYQQNFIKEGLLDDSGTTPIYGVEIGLLTSEFEVELDDKKTNVTVDKNKKIRVTPTELSLWDSDIKVAYVTEGEIYFPSARITGGSININNNFKVDSEGNLTAKKGTYSGDISASSIIASINGWSNYVKLEDGYIRTYSDGVLASQYGGTGQTYYTDGGLPIGSFGLTSYNGKKGLANVLNYGAGTFITIAGHYKFGTDTTYYPDVVWSRGDSNIIHNNIYPEEGLHISTPCYFHGSDVQDINIVSITSDGYTTRSVKTQVKCMDSDGNEYWATMEVRNGLITALFGEDL